MVRAKSITARVRAGAVLVALVPFLAGCNAEYTVEVLNEGGRPVRARLMQDQVASDSVALASVQVGPGRQARLGPVRAPVTDDVTLEVESVGDLGVPPSKQKLSSGLSRYRVGAAGDAGWGPAPITPWDDADAAAGGRR